MDKGTPAYFMWSILAAVLMACIGGMIYFMLPPGRVVGKESLLIDVFYAGVWVSFVYMAAVVVAVFVTSPFNVRVHKAPGTSPPGTAGGCHPGACPALASGGDGCPCVWVSLEPPSMIGAGFEGALAAVAGEGGQVSGVNPGVACPLLLRQWAPTGAVRTRY